MNGKSVILITGGIGGGKSEASKYMRASGIPVYDSDSRTKELYDIDKGLVKMLETALECNLRTEDGAFDRSALAGQIFSSKEKLAICENIVHPAVLADFKKWLDSCDNRIVCMESAIALSKPLFDGIYDISIYVDADENLRIERACKRDHSSAEKIAERVRNQEDLSSKADYIIENNGTVEELHDKIDKLMSSISSGNDKI